VFQEHWRSIGTHLAILYHQFGQQDAPKDFEQTLIAIDEVLASCTDKEVHLNRITYRDLQSLLLRLHIRLVQYQLDFRDNYQLKVQILIDAYHQQQILVRKVFDETMKQRLAIMYHDTEANIIEQLHLLREKHFQTIELYLRTCTELHRSVPLTGLTGSIVATVARTFYQISAEEQMQLEEQWQSYDLPLTRTFI